MSPAGLCSLTNVGPLGSGIGSLNLRCQPRSASGARPPAAEPGVQLGRLSFAFNLIVRRDNEAD